MTDNEFSRIKKAAATRVAKDEAKREFENYLKSDERINLINAQKERAVVKNIPDEEMMEVLKGVKSSLLVNELFERIADYESRLEAIQNTSNERR